MNIIPCGCLSMVAAGRICLQPHEREKGADSPLPLWQNALRRLQGSLYSGDLNDRCCVTAGASASFRMLAQVCL
jgi:hypothetical protein